MTISQSRLQSLLAQSPVFLSRIQTLMCTIASSVLSETGVGTDHPARANYAKLVLSNPNGTASTAATFISQSVNVANTVTYEDEGVRTSVTDAALLAQIAADWLKLAGADKGN